MVNINQKASFCISSAKSGSGKTMITCGLIKALRDRGYRVQSFKAGPDYIDPLFHDAVSSDEGIGLHNQNNGDSRFDLHNSNPACENLDIYMAGYEGVREIFKEKSQGADISVIEGVMGLFDGIRLDSNRYSTYDTAVCLSVPVILVIDAKGAMRSAVAMIKGFAAYDTSSLIRGVILNRCTRSVADMLAPVIMEELGVRCFGAVPEAEDIAVESRYLGLVLPDEVVDIKQKVGRLASLIQESVDIDGIIETCSCV